MDVVGSEIGMKMRSAIKAKLTELGCYVDDELPDYVMVMVANKRTRAQMEDDLQLFLGDNTELFVNWLHQVLKKLQEVTVTAPLKIIDIEKSRDGSKDKKSKEKKGKDKVKKSDLKKAKKKSKEHRKKEEKKAHKTKKKSKHHEMIRPNIPPLFMNIEKDSEPSITDVFAGQILKNHGITLDPPMDEPKIDEPKPILNELKRSILPIIDPATIFTQTEPQISIENITITHEQNTDEIITEAPREEQLKEINEIEAKIQGLKQKLVEQLDSMSEDEDFLNIRTEADELMTDFVEDVLQEISQPVAVTSPIQSRKTPTPPPTPQPTLILDEPRIPIEPPNIPIETLPYIELKLPKRSIRERLGVREEPASEIIEKKKTDKRKESPERFTPEREPVLKPQLKSAKARLGDPTEPQKRNSITEDTSADKTDTSSKRLTSKVSVRDNRVRTSCASVVRVRPRPRVATSASSLLFRAVAEAHKSLLNIPPKIDPEPQVKRALVFPMRRTVEAQKIVIQVPGDQSQVDTPGDTLSIDEVDSEEDKSSNETEKEELRPAPITKKIINTDYVPLRRNEHRTTSKRDDTLIIETLNIHNPTVDKDKNTQFIVTMDGYHPNAFLAKKLLTEGLLNDEDEINKSKPTSDIKKTIEKSDEKSPIKEKSPVKENISLKEKTSLKEKSPLKEMTPFKDKTPLKEKTELKEKSPMIEKSSDISKKEIINLKKRLSNTSEESDTQIIIKHANEKELEKHKSNNITAEETSPPLKKRRASPIVFDVIKKEKDGEKERQRTESVGSDNHVTVMTNTTTHKYDSVPPLSQAERNAKVLWCRAFPLCRYGNACAFSHPRCKFAAACTRRNCVYSHALPLPSAPSVASHVVPAANYKTISNVAQPSMCKYYPSCVNPACHFYHPKPCRYGKNCGNKLECNFYHADTPASKWRYPV